MEQRSPPLEVVDGGELVEAPDAANWLAPPAASPIPGAPWLCVDVNADSASYGAVWAVPNATKAGSFQRGWDCSESASATVLCIFRAGGTVFMTRLYVVCIRVDTHCVSKILRHVLTPYRGSKTFWFAPAAEVPPRAERHAGGQPAAALRGRGPALLAPERPGHAHLRGALRDQGAAGGRDTRCAVTKRSMDRSSTEYTIVHHASGRST